MNKSSENRLTSLYPEFARRVRLLVQSLAKQGFQLEVTQGLRTVEEQNALYAQGRNGDKRPQVTDARGGRSYHNFGLAVDFALVVNGKLGWPEPHPVWKAIGREAARVGLEWGGTWRKPDLPHVQMKPVPPVSLCYSLYQRAGLPLVWSEVERLQPK